jgi:hypothetical protein
VSEIQPDDALHPDKLYSPEEWALKQERDRERKNLRDLMQGDWPEELPGTPA